MNYVFATPILIIDIPTINEIQLDIDNSLSNVSFINKTDIDHGSIDISDGNLEGNVIEKYALINLKKEILKYSLSYIEQLDINTEIPLRITKSWFTKIDGGGRGAVHAHNCLIAGVYYYKADGDEGFLRFHNSEFNDIRRLFQGRYADLEPKTGKLVLFPGYLPHEICTNTTNKIRLSIGFHLDV
jgi:uncharacterized protein (TIGR02466 family)